MRIGELGKTYYIVELNHSMPVEVREWLIEKFGNPDRSRWFMSFQKVYFADPKDHLMFTLRWA